MYAKASYNYVEFVGYLDTEVLRPTENCYNNNNTMLWYNISLYESILHTLRRAYIASSLGILYNTMGLQVCKYSTAKLDGSLNPDNHLIEQTLKLT